MDAGIAFLFCFIIVITAIVMGTVKEVTKRAIALKEKQIEAQKAVSAPALASDVAARLDKMEQRLRVLERIATDGGTDTGAALAREIDALRAQQEEAHGVPLNLKEKVQ
ncbi:hypothetical protein [Altererythrobacter lauratis]|uniref:Uncharacterized protein n=1 Tax=Alteraurantiacibacter lauratis TaxID=2054627 RepID=A0ABV7EDN3_9SPHN